MKNQTANPARFPILIGSQTPQKVIQDMKPLVALLPSPLDYEGTESRPSLVSRRAVIMIVRRGSRFKADFLQNHP